MAWRNLSRTSGAAHCGLALSFLLVCPFWAEARADKKAEAEKLYSQALAMMHESLDNKTINQALALLEKAAELDPKNKEIWVQLAWRYWMLGDDMSQESKEEKKQRQELFEKGQAAGEKAMAINKRSVGGLYWYNVNMAAGGEMKGILESLSLAGQLFSNISRVDRRDPYYLYGATRRFGSEIFVRVPTWLTERLYRGRARKMLNYFDNYTYLARVYVWSD